MVLNENWGALAAVLSSVLGGTAIGATRYLAHAIDPLVLGALRFGIGTVVLLPLACLHRGRWPAPRDWPGAMSLCLLFFGLFPILFNAALIFTTAARGALALATLPLLTMIAAALLHVEALTPRKTAGVMISIAGVVLSLLSDLTSAPAGAWRGDMLMVGAALCMSLYKCLVEADHRALQCVDLHRHRNECRGSVSDGARRGTRQLRRGHRAGPVAMVGDRLSWGVRGRSHLFLLVLCS